MSLADDVKTRMGGSSSDILVQLSNQDSSATTINDAVLGGACDDAQGEFERITGLAFDSTNKSHVSVMVQGVLYFLELYKSRTSAITGEHKKAFYGSCIGMRGSIWITPGSTSNLDPSQDSANELPDMDRKRRVFLNRRNQQLHDYNNFE